MAGLGANFECDLKGIIALSTLRQLGLIIITIIITITISIGLSGLAYYYETNGILKRKVWRMCSMFKIFSTYIC
jgi:formate hydrogenlyase subunit 3/multisubunit Na+/H+ antiporter MnhD subunit